MKVNDIIVKNDVKCNCDYACFLTKFLKLKLMKVNVEKEEERVNVIFFFGMTLQGVKDQKT